MPRAVVEATNYTRPTIAPVYCGSVWCVAHIAMAYIDMHFVSTHFAAAASHLSLQLKDMISALCAVRP